MLIFTDAILSFLGLLGLTHTFVPVLVLLHTWICLSGSYGFLRIASGAARRVMTNSLSVEVELVLVVLALHLAIVN